MVVFRSIRTAFSIYEACAVDIYRAFRGSWFIGLLLASFYLLFFIGGLLLGALIYEFLEPFLNIIGVFLRFPADLALEIGVLALLLYAATSIFCLVARLLVQGLTYLLFEMKGDTVFYLLVAFAVFNAVILVISILLPPVISENLLITISGFAALGTMAGLILIFWVYFRYSWAQSHGRTFDRDIGLAWSHMSDERRSKFNTLRGL